MSKTPIRKISADANAKSYWEQLFGEYGRQMSKKVPRRLKAALELELAHKRQAEKKSPLRIKALEIAPLAHAETSEGLQIEGVARGEIEGPNGSVRLARLFRASLDKEGNLTAFQSIEAV